MVYDLEDEIDWSDGPLGPPSPDCPIEQDNLHQEAADLEGLFIPEYGDRYELPTGTPLPFSKYIP